MNVSEYIIDYIEKQEIDKVFAIVGGASLWLCKALSEAKTVKTIFTNHEQTAAMAADGWARINKKPGILFTINGPGMTNAVTGIAQAWVDSSPVILITGNSNSNSVQYERNADIRQYGTQDLRTDLIMQPITKRTFFIDKPGDIKKCLQEAFYVAMEGRPGPICIEVPINIQSAEVPENMEDWKGIKDSIELKMEVVKQVIDLIRHAKKPLILAGQGVRLADKVDVFTEFVQKLDIPVVTSRMGIDIITTANKYFVGRPGNHGDRASHFALQSCDVLLILGSRMAPNTTGYDVSGFSPQSYKILVEIDNNELNKMGIGINLCLFGSISDFLEKAIQYINQDNLIVKHIDWIQCCNSWKTRYPVMQEAYYQDEMISTYHVINKISNIAHKGDYIISDTGSCCSVTAQIWDIKENQRLFISGGLSAMGYWATSMGLALSKTNGNHIICIVGDGSLQMNIQELATIKQYQLPIKIFLINNNGYQFVRMSQMSYGFAPPFGTDAGREIPIADTEKIAKAYGITYLKCNEIEKLESIIQGTMETPESVICEIFVNENQEVCPRLKSVALEGGTFRSPKYEDLYPFLSEDILKKEMCNI